MASTSSSATIASPPANYDIFLSFRGEDTRHSFTDHLYDALGRAGVLTFRDNDEISRGEDLKPEIEKAIKASKGSIVVLSKNYATSTWCLDELCLILEQKREFNHFVLPVFYHVDPSDVRKQDKTFKIEVNISSKWTDENVKRWKTALTKVADLTGLVLSGSETEFLKEIIDNIYNKVSRKTVNLPQNLIGMNARDKKINYWLEQSDVKVFAISGMGGSGKTTLAKYIVSSKCQHFEIVTFVEDISGTCQKQNDFEKLFQNFAKYIVGDLRMLTTKYHRKNTDRILKNKKALIVFDDIDESRQWEHFLTIRDIHEESKIIVTTRKNNVCYWLRCHEYKMQLLDADESLELLSLHAFGSKSPMEGYEELTKEVLHYCEGNPLALQVLGSSLSEDISILFWRSTLDLLKRDMNSGIQRVLVRSYASLPNKTSKELFLHIACFFVGEDKDYVEQILEHDYCASSGIQVLNNRCLLSVSPNNKLMMHQLIQEMGKSIIREESKRPAERSRVWLCSDSYKILGKGEGSKTMEGLALDMQLLEKPSLWNVGQNLKHDPYNVIFLFLLDYTLFILMHIHHGIGTFDVPLIYTRLRPEEQFLSTWWHLCALILDIMYAYSLSSMLNLQSSNLKTDSLTKMDNLKLLQLNDVHLTGSYEEFSEDLRWLCWRRFHLTAIPSGLFQGNLVTIDMRDSKLQVFEPPIVLQFLKTLDLQGSMSLSKIRNISRLPNLETLILCRCFELVHVCESIGSLMNLAILNMMECLSLPGNFYMVFGRQLASTSGGGRQQRTSLPSLVWLTLKGNIIHDLFPLSFNVQLKLQYLDLGGGSFESLPSYNHLKNLRVLDLSWCTGLKWLICLPSALVELYVDFCGKLEKITFESHKFTLQEFSCHGCYSLSEIEGFIKLVLIAKLVRADLGHMAWLKGYEYLTVPLFGDVSEDDELSTISRIKMLYEFGIMSTSLPDIQDPNLINGYISKSPSLSFEVPSCPKNRRLIGLNISFKYTISGDYDWAWFAKISTNSGVAYIYNPYVFGNPGVGAVGIWLSYWPIGSKLNVGDEVNVSIVVMNGTLKVHECGATLVYENKDDTLKINMQRDLSAFQLRTGAFYLCRRDFFKLMEIGRLIPGWLSHLVGDNGIDDREVRGWRKTGGPALLGPTVTELSDSSLNAKDGKRTNQ